MKGDGAETPLHVGAAGAHRRCHHAAATLGGARMRRTSGSGARTRPTAMKVMSAALMGERITAGIPRALVGERPIKALLDPKVQLSMLKEYGYGPVLKSVTVPPELAKMAPVGERAAKLYTPDWAVINDKREEWTKRWNREVER